MVCYPDVLKKVQEELDVVIGRNRLPKLEDRPRLPYADAVLKETLRWNSVVPMGVSTQLLTYAFAHFITRSPTRVIR